MQLMYVQVHKGIAKSLVVVVVSSEQVVKPLSRLAVVQPEVLHLLECLLGLASSPGPLRGRERAWYTLSAHAPIP